MARPARGVPLRRGPKPPGPKYGKARAVHEWKLWTRTLAAAAVALGLLQAAIWYVGDAADTGGLQTWQFAALRVLGIQAVIAATYTLWPRKAPAAEPQEEPAEVRR